MSAQEETVQTIEPVTPPAGEVAPPEKAVATDDTQPGDRDEKGRFRNPVQPRIDELTRKSREAEREAAYWRGRAEAAEKPPEPKAEKPKVEDFENYGDYVEALTDWKADEKIKANDEKRDKRTAEERAAEQREKSWAEKAADARTRVPDYDQVMSESTVQISDHVAEALRESDRGPELAVQLAKDPSIADKLNAMSPHRAAIELGRMEAKLPAVSAEPDPNEVPADERPAPTPAPAKKTTSAPPPVKPIARTATTTKDLSKLSMDDYVKERSAQGAKWARR